MEETSNFLDGIVESPCRARVADKSVRDMVDRLAKDYRLRIDCCLNTKACKEGVRKLFHEESKAPYALVFAKTSYAGMASSSPYLLPFEPESGFLDWMIQEAGKFGFLGLTAAGQDTVLAHWRSLLNTLMPDGTVSHFRFYSSLVCERMLSASSDKEIGWFLGPYAYLLLPSENEGEWLLVSHPDVLVQEMDVARSCSDLVKKYEPVHKTWWQTTDAHMAAVRDLLDKVFVHNMVQHLFEEDSGQAVAVDHAHEEGGLHNFVEQAVAMAKARGFSDTDHISSMVRIYLYNGLEIDQDPALEKLFERGANSSESLLSGIRRLYGTSGLTQEETTEQSA